jgi:hypothetical protein
MEEYSLVAKKDLLQLKEGKDRLDVAVHYGIAYPRLHHKQQLVDHLYPPDLGRVGMVPPSRYAPP